MKKILSLFAIFAMCFCFSAATAKADGGGSGDLLYTITGPASNPITVTFELPQNPSIGGPDNFNSGFGFQVEPINLMVNNNPVDGDCLFFYNVGWGGGLEDNNMLFSLINPDGSNVALYTGDESAPTMTLLLGPVSLDDFDSGTPGYTLTVAQVTAPEPASLMLLASGIVALFLMLKFRTA